MNSLEFSLIVELVDKLTHNGQMHRTMKIFLNILHENKVTVVHYLSKTLNGERNYLASKMISNITCTKTSDISKHVVSTKNI